MALHRATLDQDTVLRTLGETVRVLERDQGGFHARACDALGIGTPEWEACRNQVIEELQEAESWVEREDTLVQQVSDEPPVDSQTDALFLPSNATLALFQSAMNEHLDTVDRDGFQPRDVKSLSIVYQRLRKQVRGKAPFVQHASMEDFRFDLPERGSVALVSDWGTGNAHAAAVAAQITHRNPAHVIHLGDVYFAGTPREMGENYLDMWARYGPVHETPSGWSGRQSPKHWALNGNHDMYKIGRAHV